MLVEYRLDLRVLKTLFQANKPVTQHFLQKKINTNWSQISKSLRRLSYKNIVIMRGNRPKLFELNWEHPKIHHLKEVILNDA